jgi:DNA-binding response OmpR family regulator
VATILIIEDEVELAELIRRQLEGAGHQPQVAHNGRDGLRLALEHPPDLLILDLMLPGLDGMTICRQLRERSTVPILILTARADEADRVLGLEIGADDYLTKPFSLRELLARVRAMLRRVELLRPSEPADQTPICHGPLRLDLLDRRVTLAEQPLELTVKEYELLRLLVQHPGRSFSRFFLLDRIWGQDYLGGERTVDTHVVRLRRKLGPVGEQIETVWGVGYRFEGRAT